MTTDTTDHIAAIRELTDYLDSTRGWDVATYLEYERLRDIAIAEHDALASELKALRKERNYWKSATEDPYLYWGVDNPPYSLDDEREDQS